MERLIQIQREILTAYCAKVVVVAVETSDEDGLLRAVKTVAADRKAGVAEWSCASGWKNGGAIEGGALSLEEALAAVGDTAKRAIVVMYDPFPWLLDPMSPQGTASAGPVRKVKELVSLLKGQPKETSRLLLLVGRSLTLPPDLSGEVPVLKLGMPDTEELRSLLSSAAQEAGLKLEEDACCSVAEAGTGLSVSGFMQAVKRSLVATRTVSPAVIYVAKKEQLKGSALEQIDVPELDSIDEGVGGMDLAKAFIMRRVKGWSPEAQKLGLEKPKGVIVTGVAGSGKTQLALAVAGLLKLPLLKLNFGALMGKYLGESEAAGRRVRQIIDAYGRCVVLFDEIDRGLGGGGSGELDGGTSSRMLGDWLTWKQESTNDALIIATSNNIDRLPPEVTRAGRWDAMFFVDLPNEVERRAIFNIHLRKRGVNASQVNELVTQDLIRKTNGFVGAEIEAVVVAARFLAFDENGKLSLCHLLEEAATIVPLSVSAAAKVQSIRDWAKGRCRPASSVPVAAATAESLGGLESLSS